MAKIFTKKATLKKAHRYEDWHINWEIPERRLHTVLLADIDEFITMHKITIEAKIKLKKPEKIKLFEAELSRLIAAKINYGNPEQAEIPEESDSESDAEVDVQLVQINSDISSESSSDSSDEEPVNFSIRTSRTGQQQES